MIEYSSNFFRFENFEIEEAVSLLKSVKSLRLLDIDALAPLSKTHTLSPLLDPSPAISKVSFCVFDLQSRIKWPILPHL